MYKYIIIARLCQQKQNRLYTDPKIGIKSVLLERTIILNTNKTIDKKSAQNPYKPVFNSYEFFGFFV